jgi:hypothetical protein
VKGARSVECLGASGSDIGRRCGAPRWRALAIAMSHAPHVPCCTLLLLMIRWGSGVRATGVPDLEETVRSGPH